MAKSIKELRQERGFRSAREFADALGIAASSMSRYDRDPESIPLKHAWAMADLLDCSIDEVVGREHVTSGTSELQELYDGLLPENRALMDDFIEFVRMRDERARLLAKAEEDARSERLCERYERMFLHALYDGIEFGELVDFDTPLDERAQFELYLRQEAAKKRKPSIDLEVETVEEEMRDGYIDADGTEKSFTEDEIETALEGERRQLEDEFEKRDEEVIRKIMEAYDRLHARELRNWAVHSGQGVPPTTIEYFASLLRE